MDRAGESVGQHKLCYVYEQWAYFTTQPLDKQWGDDWDDVPYEHNAGSPYEFSRYDESKGRQPWEIIQVAFDAPLESPCSRCSNSRYSVAMINSGAVAWLTTDEYRDNAVVIPAGTTLPRFCELVREAGGHVFLKPEDMDKADRCKQGRAAIAREHELLNAMHDTTDKNLARQAAERLQQWAKRGG